MIIIVLGVLLSARVPLLIFGTECNYLGSTINFDYPK